MEKWKNVMNIVVVLIGFSKNVFLYNMDLILNVENKNLQWKIADQTRQKWNRESENQTQKSSQTTISSDQTDGRSKTSIHEISGWNVGCEIHSWILQYNTEQVYEGGLLNHYCTTTALMFMRKSPTLHHVN